MVTLYVLTHICSYIYICQFQISHAVAVLVLWAASNPAQKVLLSISDKIISERLAGLRRQKVSFIIYLYVFYLTKLNAFVLM